MKNIITTLFAFICICTVNGAEHPYKLDDKSSKTTTLKRILLDPSDKKPAKRARKVVEFDLVTPSLPIPPLPDNLFSSRIITLLRMSKSCEYRSAIRFIYDDAQRSGIREIAGVTRDGALKLVEQMRQTREYAQPTTFGNYIIRHSERGPIGRLLFANYAFGKTPGEGFVEVQFHLISEFRGQGLGAEALECLTKGLIDSKIGKQCSFMRSVSTQPWLVDKGGAGTFTSTLRGVYGKGKLLSTHALDNYGKIASYYKAGFGVKLWNGDVIMSYPPDCYPLGPSLPRNEVAVVISISKLMQDCRDMKMQSQKANQKALDSVSSEITIDLKEILNNFAVYAQKIASLKKQYRKLLSTSEPFTFLSTLNILHTEFGMAKQELEADVSVERAQTMCNFLEKETEVPDGLYFLRTFIPFTLYLSLSYPEDTVT